MKPCALFLRRNRILYFITVSAILLALSVSQSVKAEGQCSFCSDCIPPCDSLISEYCSPIVIDVSGGGFKLTSAKDGVRFDISGTGKPLQISWVAPGAMNAFLVLDRNGNGVIDNGKELFGNFTEQPPSANPNGFAALAEFDKPENGGNGDGVIDNKDLIFGSLRLWIDKNHDGVSQPDELFTLPSMGVYSISLSYKEVQRRDQYGNLFRYRSRLNTLDQDPTKAGPVAYDVFFTGLNTP